MSDRPIEIVGHGGAGGYYPGNGRPSMERALEIGVDRLECDLQRARDGTIVLVHDDAVTAPGGVRLKVAALTTSQLTDLIPDLLTLNDLVELVRGRVPFMLDIKRSGYESDVIAAIGRHGLARDSSVSTTYASTVLRIHRAFPEMRIGLSVGDWASRVLSRPGGASGRLALQALFPIGLPRGLALLGASETMLHHRVITRRLVEAIQRAGQRVNAWTVDDEAEMRNMVECGVDGIISNRPDVARRVVRPDEEAPVDGP